MVFRITVVASAGAAIGKLTFQKICHSEYPSMRAASNRSEGMRAKKLSRMYTVSGSCTAMYTSVKPIRLLYSWYCTRIWKSEMMVICGGKMIAEKMTK